MSKNMDPAMMQQAQAMMSNPAMAQQAMNQMENMSGDDLKSRLNQASAALPAAAPAAPVSVLAKLKASAMEVPDELLELVEEAEGAKTQGNTKFKGSDHSAASAQYKHGCTLVDRVLKKGVLTGADKKAVQELKDACHLNLANCQLKLEDWEGAATECDVVLERGANRKALFRRGQARLKQERLEEALADLTKARDMLPSDEIVAGFVKEAEAKLGIESVETPPAPARAPAAARAGGGMPGMGMPGMPSDPAEMERMLDQISPEQMAQQAEMLEQRSRLRRGPPLAAPPWPPPGLPWASSWPPGALQAPWRRQAFGSSRGAAQSLPGRRRCGREARPSRRSRAVRARRKMDPEQLKAMAPQLGGMDASQIKMMSKMMAGMKPEDMKSMAKMAQQMQGSMPGAAAAGGGSSSTQPGAGSSSAVAAGAAANPMAGMDMANMDMSKGLDMMGSMTPDMMKAGMDMMKNMDPKAMASMSKMMGREISEGEMEKMQSMMADMKPEDMEKLAKGAQTLAGFAKKPMAAYQGCRSLLAKAGAGGLLAGVMAILAVMAVGHVTESF